MSVTSAAFHNASRLEKGLMALTEKTVTSPEKMAHGGQTYVQPSASFFHKITQLINQGSDPKALSELKIHLKGITHLKFTDNATLKTTYEALVKPQPNNNWKAWKVFLEALHPNERVKLLEINGAPVPFYQDLTKRAVQSHDDNHETIFLLLSTLAQKGTWKPEDFRKADLKAIDGNIDKYGTHKKEKNYPEVLATCRQEANRLATNFHPNYQNATILKMLADPIWETPEKLADRNEMLRLVESMPTKEGRFRLKAVALPHEEDIEKPTAEDLSLSTFFADVLSGKWKPDTLI